MRRVSITLRCHLLCAFSIFTYCRTVDSSLAKLFLSFLFRSFAFFSFYLLRVSLPILFQHFSYALLSFPFILSFFFEVRPVQGLHARALAAPPVDPRAGRPGLGRRGARPEGGPPPAPSQPIGKESQSVSQLAN